MRSKRFPPKGLQDLSRTSAGNVLSLGRSLSRRPCTVLVGAGVSASCGLPSWNHLLINISRIYFTHWEFEISNNPRRAELPPQELSVAFCEECLWTEESLDVAKDLLAKGNALSVAQMILSRVREDNRQYLIRKALFGEHREIVKPSPLVEAVATTCAACGVTAVVSFNYDDILERALRSRGLTISRLWAAEAHPKPGSIPVYYPHGYLKQGGGPLVPIILGEDDYNAYSTISYDWRNLIQLRLFSSTSCLFVGCSLSDPQLRRLMWVAKRSAEQPHFAFLPSEVGTSSSASMIEALQDSQLGDLGVRVIRYPLASSGDPHGRLNSLLRLLTDAAKDPDVLWK